MNCLKIRIFSQASEQNSAQLEEDKKHLEFMNSIKKYDADVPSEAEVAGGDMTASVMDTSKVGSKISAGTIKILSSNSGHDGGAVPGRGRGRWRGRGGRRQSHALLQPVPVRAAGQRRHGPCSLVTLMKYFLV